jgi:hypothetical protein
MFGWFPHLINSLFASIDSWVWIESPLCAEMFFIFLIFGGIFDPIFVLVISRVFDLFHGKGC